MSRKKAVQPISDTFPWSEPRTLEFFVVSYHPHPLTPQSANVAVVLFGDGFADVRIAPDWLRVTAIDPRADVKLLSAVVGEIKDKLQAADAREQMLRTMEDSWSDAIQVSPRKGIVTPDPTTEIEKLASQYLIADYSIDGLSVKSLSATGKVRR
jgi:hypothetical protein